MTRFIYKTLTSEHAETWRELRLEGARDFPLGFLTTFDETEAISLDRCREILGYHGMRGVFAGEELVGFCGYRPQHLERIRHRGEIGPFFVTRSRQGSGAAKTMMAGVIAEAKGNGLAQLELFVDTENLRARAFYEGQGFEHVATFSDNLRIDGKPRNSAFMTLRL
ncbi:GNAT family N-acetyltransferase [uncultured Roseobacter sp.]|uniref:GNAT family N-acetyltransferase n=1 Tax=uncultured Roseobacter sp. TaxID=114847 RepID=UPI00261FBDEA|nr:GNAT family N-acetyltransferase [uncultured Roseobacter sp.]